MRLLDNVPEGKELNLGKGEKIKNLRQLVDSIKIMEDLKFNKSIEGKNRFANWIKWVFNEEKLFNKLVKCKNKNDTLNILNKSINSEVTRLRKEREEFFYRAKEEQDRLLRVVSRGAFDKSEANVKKFVKDISSFAKDDIKISKKERLKIKGIKPNNTLSAVDSTTLIEELKEVYNE